MELDIENETLKGTIDDLSSNDYPGLALLKNQSLIVIKSIDFKSHCMHCIDSMVGHKIFTFEKFDKLWSGVIIRTSLSKSSEIIHSKDSYSRIISRKILQFPFSATISFLLLGIFFSIPVFEALSYSKRIFFLGIINLTGLILSLFFFWGAAKSSFFFQKICTASGVFDCKKVINSPAGKLFGTSLIEWGIVYFSNCILMIFLGLHSDNFIIYENLIALITIAAMIYSLYLLTYQFAYLKKICLLCMVLQICIWSEFFILQKSIDFSFRWISVYLVTIFMLCLLTIFLTWKSIKYVIYMGWKMEKNEIELLKTRRNPEYIDFILSNAEKINTGRFSKELAYGGDVEVAKIVYYYLLADGTRASLKVLRDWFYMENNARKNVKKRLKFFQQRYPCINKELISEAENIVNAHREWGSSIPIISTPLILCNDIQLPKNFQISDLT
jgi:uncharacterized membrane protein